MTIVRTGSIVSVCVERDGRQVSIARFTSERKAQAFIDAQEA